jgi:hypothetical protein
MQVEAVMAPILRRRQNETHLIGHIGGEDPDPMRATLPKCRIKGKQNWRDDMIMKKDFLAYFYNTLLIFNLAPLSKTWRPCHFL